MKFKAICENHLYSKAYSKGKRAVTSALAVYVLPDYAAKRLAKSHPEKRIVNRIGLTTSKALGGAVVRSRARRVLREGLRQVEKERPLKVGFLIVKISSARERIISYIWVFRKRRNKLRVCSA